MVSDFVIEKAVGGGRGRASSRRVNYFYQLPSELGNRASCKLRKTLVFIRFDEEGTIFKKEKRLNSVYYYNDYQIPGMAFR